MRQPQTSVVHASTKAVMMLNNSMQALTNSAMELGWQKFHCVCPRRVEGALTILRRIEEMMRRLRCLMTGRFRM